MVFISGVPPGDVTSQEKAGKDVTTWAWKPGWKGEGHGFHSLVFYIVNKNKVDTLLEAQ